MVTSPLEVALADTQNAVIARKDGRSWRRFAADVQVPHGILHAIGHGKWEHVSWDTVRVVRRRVGLPDPGPVVPAFACPSCSGLHVGDCHGRPVAEVVCLTAGEVIQPAPGPRRPRPRKRAFRPYITDARKKAAYLEWSRQWDREHAP